MKFLGTVFTLLAVPAAVTATLSYFHNDTLFNWSSSLFLVFWLFMPED